MEVLSFTVLYALPIYDFDLRVCAYISARSIGFYANWVCISSSPSTLNKLLMITIIT